MSPEQCRAARAFLSLTQPDLAAAAAIGLSTVLDFEKERRQVSQAACDAMRTALETRGVLFLNEENGLGAGLRLRKAKKNRR
jgi:DNA-binding transcriptional regulator YiaG